MELRVDGRKVFAATGGRLFDAATPVVVFIHGAGMDHTVWPLQARWFAHHGRSVLAVDLPGHGRSEGKPIASVEALGAWLGELIAASGVPQAALVGHSMGALAAFEAAAQAPDRVAKLALLGISSPMAVHPDLLKAAQAGETLASELVASWGFGRRAHLGGHQAPGLWMLGGGLSLLETGPRGALGIDLAACNAYQGAGGAAGKVKCPTLFLCGAADIMTPPKAAAALANQVAGAKVVTLPDAGHMMMIERPDATLAALKNFL
ncbi:MAG: alpha/beta fold hydrolase [Alphaproteobacteria bacterium]